MGCSAVSVRKHVVVFHETTDPAWQWISHHLPEFEWVFVRAPAPGGGVLSKLARLRCAFQAARAARSADLVVSLGPGLGSALEIARRIIGVTTQHCSYYLNFDHMPYGLTRKRQALPYRMIDRFVVSSTMERSLYSAHFGIDPERIDVILWSVNPPVATDRRLVEGDYICAVGGNARDYAMLVRIARSRPHMQFVIVARPANLEGLDIPPNVTSFCNIPFSDTMAIVRDARAMALPLIATDTPCGHVTIVAAFYLGTPVAATDSTGITDYIHDGENGLIAESGSDEALRNALDRLWNDPALANRIGEAGRAFASAHCAETNYSDHVRKLLSY